MDLNDSPAEAAFRLEARTWLSENAPPADESGRTASILNEAPGIAEVEEGRAWQVLKADAGWAGLTWPVEFGGRGLGPIEHVIWQQEERRVRTPPDVFFVGLGVVGPLLVHQGTLEQQQRHLRAILRGEQIFCQLFSEPSAGSDLAAVRTTARRDGDDWVIDGQKVWTSFADHARYGLVLARTNPEARKYDGLTLFIVDMEDEGVDARPIKQVSGHSPFSEVFLENVRVTDDNRVGAVDLGWRGAMAVLQHERTSVGAAGYQGMGWDDLLRVARGTEVDGRPALEDPHVRQRLAALYVRLSGIERTGWRTLTAIAKTGKPGPESSVGKLAVALVARDGTELGHALQGAEGVLLDEQEADAYFWSMAWLESPALRIVSGSDEIQRNIIGEQVLRLPPEPRVDKELPFNQLPTGPARAS